MKFTCDSCGAAYMISDEKVGPNGVRVRCKKCGTQITVRRMEDPRPAPVLERTGPATGRGLDEELGSAFDHAFGDQPGPGPGPATPSAPPAAAAPVAPAIAAAGEAPAAPAAPVAASPAAPEWHVAIGEAQVGPLPLLEVRKRWEAGDIGPDSLVWRPGMAEWGALSAVAELAAFLAPVPQPNAPAAAPSSSVFAAPAGRQPTAASRDAAEPEVEWKPTGASALAALASEELASRAPAASQQATPPRSVMEQLPDSGGVDPTGSIPLSIKAMEQTGERPAHRSSVARGAEELRHKRTVRSVVLLAALVVVAVIAGASAWVQLAGRAAAPVAVAPPAPTAAPAVASPPVAPPPVTAAAGNALATAPAPAEAPAPAAAEPAPAKVAEAATPRKPRPPQAAPPPDARPARPPVAQAAPAARPPRERPATERDPAEKPAARKKDGVLDFDQGGDDDLAAALGSGAGGRKVFVPPPAGGAAATPDRIGDAQIMESVRLHADDLQRCVAEQRARDPGAKGTIKLAWVIQPDGTTRDVRCITPEFAQGDFAQCMIGVVRAIRFPRVGDPKGQGVTFPFAF
jgi:predicted Zn finger-like uncharacterized protein